MTAPLRLHVHFFNKFLARTLVKRPFVDPIILVLHVTKLSTNCLYLDYSSLNKVTFIWMQISKYYIVCTIYKNE